MDSKKKVQNAVHHTMKQFAEKYLLLAPWEGRFSMQSPLLSQIISSEYSVCVHLSYFLSSLSLYIYIHIYDIIRYL